MGKVIFSVCLSVHTQGGTLARSGWGVPQPGIGYIPLSRDGYPRPGMGYPPVQRWENLPPPQDRTADGVPDMRQVVYLLCSRRRTFLVLNGFTDCPFVYYFIYLNTHYLFKCTVYLRSEVFRELHLKYYN